MKKTSILLSLLTAGVMGYAQTTRLSLYEEFTGENCPPCASTNPGLQVILNANASKMVSIKWQVPIPSAPTNTWSLYQTDKTEIDWRWRGWNGATTSTVINGPSASGYGYPTQSSAASTTITSGVNSAPSGRIDGQHQWTFGAASDHPANLNATHINNAQAVSSPFSVSMSRAWDPTFTAVTVTVSITAAQNFTASAPLIFRLVMVEEEIHFATAPGTNGEKDFYNAVRASFPTLQNGTALPSAWTTGQNQTFTVNCTLPSYIIDKSQVNMIGWIQNDNATTQSRMVYQAAKTTTVGISNDAAAAAISGNYMSCGTMYSPQVTVKNNGTNPITTMTIIPTLDATAGAPYAWTGSIAPGATVAIAMPTLAPTGGTHTYSVNITSVNGATDNNPANNTKLAPFAFVTTYAAPPVVEPFTAATFPPTGWFMNNANGGANTWSRSATVGGYGTGLGSAKYDFYNNSVIGDKDELFIKPVDFTGLTNMALSFDVAYAQYSTELDKLEVFVSTNCGSTWASLYNKSGSTLSTAPAQTAVFNPTATQWRTDVVNLGAYSNNPNVIIKFVATSDYGNNLYLDNINLITTTSVKNNGNLNTVVELYPNPAQNEANVSINTPNAHDVTITMLNSLGQLVTQKSVSLEAGNNVVNFDTKNLASGLYNVVIADKNGNTTVKKLTISK